MCSLLFVVADPHHPFSVVVSHVFVLYLHEYCILLIADCWRLFVLIIRSR